VVGQQAKVHRDGDHESELNLRKYRKLEQIELLHASHRHLGRRHAPMPDGIMPGVLIPIVAESIIVADLDHFPMKIASAFPPT
jgi:hypothetical protein